MVQRSVCLCDGKYIGIESIFTVIDGKQINIPDKLSALRTRSRKGELFCPCGCGANLILVAGDRNLRAQHFRLKDSARQHECTAETERPHSIYSKIVLKCWLDEKLNVPDVETRVPICLVGDTARKYEFCRGRANLRLVTAVTARICQTRRWKFSVRTAAVFD